MRNNNEEPEEAIQQNEARWILQRNGTNKGELHQNKKRRASLMRRYTTHIHTYTHAWEAQHGTTIKTNRKDKVQAGKKFPSVKQRWRDNSKGQKAKGPPTNNQWKRREMIAIMQRNVLKETHRWKLQQKKSEEKREREREITLRFHSPCLHYDEDCP